MTKKKSPEEALREILNLSKTTLTNNPKQYSSALSTAPFRRALGQISHLAKEALEPASEYISEHPVTTTPKLPTEVPDAPETLKTGEYTWDEWEKLKKNEIAPRFESGEFHDITESLMPGIVLSSWTMRMLVLDTTTNRLYLCCGYNQTPLGWVTIKKTPWQDTVRKYEADAIQTGDSST